MRELERRVHCGLARAIVIGLHRELLMLHLIIARWSHRDLHSRLPLEPWLEHYCNLFLLARRLKHGGVLAAVSDVLPDSY